MKKTSQTDPLRIDAVPVGHLGGLIGMTLCPGKKIDSAVSGDWERDLDADLATIAAWGATALLSLMEPHEFERLGVARMQQCLPAGIEHFILPIVDGGVPSGTWARAGQIPVPGCASDSRSASASSSTAAGDWGAPASWRRASGRVRGGSGDGDASGA